MSEQHFCLEVNRYNLNDHRILETDSIGDVALRKNQVLLEVEKLGLTSNNVTYGLAGDVLGYWKFFPAEKNWGRIPAWGIAKVVRSNGTPLKEGDRYYGYFPMSSHLIVDVSDGEGHAVTDMAFIDKSEHRQAMAPFYNQYMKVVPEFGFEPEYDDHQMLYRPLFTTAFVLQDFLAVNDFYSADKIILGSASSKTALGIAEVFAQKSPSVSLVGLTSKKNKSFVESTGLYSDVVCYEEIESAINASLKYGFVDMSGDQGIINQLREHLRDNLTLHLGVGATHWDADPRQKPSEHGPEKTSFFAPTEIDQRIASWGEKSFFEQLGTAWNGFLSKIDGWVEIEYSDGPTGLEDAFNSLLNGATPGKGLVVRP